MKKIKKSFADRARELQRKYKNASYDPMQAQELEDEMTKLMAEQEMMRSVMGLNEQPQQVQQFGTGGETEDPETIQRNNEPTYPSWLPSWGKSALEGLNYVNTLGNSLGNNGDLITGIAPVPGRGFKGGYKNFTQNLPRTLPKQTFSTAKNAVASRPNITTGATAAEKLAAREAETMNRLVNAPGGLGKQFPSGTEKTIMDELVSAPGSLSKQFPNGATNLGQKAGRGVVSQAQVPYITPQRPVGYLDNISDDVASNINMNSKTPWKGIGYGAAGIGGAGVLGAGIYGLTQLPDGRVVDKQGKIVPPEQVKTIQDSVKTQFSLRNTPTSSIGTPVLPYTPAPTLDANGYPVGSWAARQKYATQQVKSASTGDENKSDTKIGTKKGSSAAAQSKAVQTQQQVLDPSGWNNVVDNIALSGPVAQQPNYYNQLYENVKGYNQNNRKSEVINNLNKELNPANKPDKESFWDKNKQFLPQAIGGLSNIAGNLLLAAMSKKAPQITPSLAYAEKINLEPKAEQLRRDANVSKNVNMTNARNLGLNPGATLGNLGVINSGIDRGLGANLTDLYMGQEQANVGATNQFALQNQDAINRVNMINSQMKFQKEDDRMNYIAQALSVPANIAKEITMAKSDKEMKAILDRYYQSMGRNYQTQGSVYGENAFTTKVRK